MKCTPTERWHRPDQWVVKKPQNKKATRVFDMKALAVHYIEKYPPSKPADVLVIEKREGEDVRCKDYCIVRKFCQFNKYREVEN